jgi:hypothetical protein
LPNDHLLNPDDSVQGWPIEKGTLTVTAATGVAYVEIFGEGDDVCHVWIEYPPENGGSVQRVVTLSEQDLRSRLPEAKRKGKLRVEVRSLGGGCLEIDDFAKTCSKEVATLKIPSAVPGLPKTAFRGKKLGHSAMEGSEAHEFVFASALRQDRVMSRVVVYHGLSVDGLEFVYDDDSRQLFGKKGGKPGGDVYELGKSYLLSHLNPRE